MAKLIYNVTQQARKDRRDHLKIQEIRHKEKIQAELDAKEAREASQEAAKRQNSKEQAKRQDSKSTEGEYKGDYRSRLQNKHGKDSDSKPGTVES